MAADKKTPMEMMHWILSGAVPQHNREAAEAFLRNFLQASPENRLILQRAQIHQQIQRQQIMQQHQAQQHQAQQQLQSPTPSQPQPLQQAHPLSAQQAAHLVTQQAQQAAHLAVQQAVQQASHHQAQTQHLHPPQQGALLSTPTGLQSQTPAGSGGSGSLVPPQQVHLQQMATQLQQAQAAQMLLPQQLQQFAQQLQQAQLSAQVAQQVAQGGQTAQPAILGATSLAAFLEDQDFIAAAKRSKKTNFKGGKNGKRKFDKGDDGSGSGSGGSLGGSGGSKKKLNKVLNEQPPEKNKKKGKNYCSR